MYPPPYHAMIYSLGWEYLSQYGGSFRHRSLCREISRQKTDIRPQSNQVGPFLDPGRVPDSQMLDPEEKTKKKTGSERQGLSWYWANYAWCLEPLSRGYGLFVLSCTILILDWKSGKNTSGPRSRGFVTHKDSLKLWF